VKKFDFNDPRHEVQSWVIGYFTEEGWKTLILPHELSAEVVESVILDLNKKYTTIYSRKIMGVLEEERNKNEKGEFVGI